VVAIRDAAPNPDRVCKVAITDSSFGSSNTTAIYNSAANAKIGVARTNFTNHALPGPTGVMYVLGEYLGPQDFVSTDCIFANNSIASAVGTWYCILRTCVVRLGWNWAHFSPLHELRLHGSRPAVVAALSE
jgi:hypothetical protein